MHTVQYDLKVVSFNILNINNLRPTAKGTTLVEPTVNWTSQFIQKYVGYMFWVDYPKLP